MTIGIRNEDSFSEKAGKLTEQALIADEYRTLCETALDAKLAGLNPIELLMLAGAIHHDPVFSSTLAAMTNAWVAEQVAKHGDNFLVTPGRFEMEREQNFPLKAAQMLDRANKLALRQRLQDARKLPRG